MFGGRFGFVGAPFFLLGGPITFIIALIDTWRGSASAVVKVLISLTLDAFLAMIWPITWVLWLIMHAAGQATPIRTVFGF